MSFGNFILIIIIISLKFILSLEIQIFCRVYGTWSFEEVWRCEELRMLYFHSHSVFITIFRTLRLKESIIIFFPIRKCVREISSQWVITWCTRCLLELRGSPRNCGCPEWNTGSDGPEPPNFRRTCLRGSLRTPLCSHTQPTITQSRPGPRRQVSHHQSLPLPPLPCADRENSVLYLQRATSVQH